MKTAEQPKVISLDPDDVKVFVHRDRDREEFEAMRDSIKELGQKQPAQVRDITSWPKDERQKPGGGLYKWGLITGEGRLLACKELGKKLLCEVKEVNNAEAVGLFLSENLNRDSIPWAQRARLVKRDVDAGMSLEEVAKKYFISQGHVRKFVRILNHVAHDIEEEIANLSMNDAEVLAALPKEHQSVVIAVANEEGLKGELKRIISKAREVVSENGDLSKTALKASLTRVDDELRRVNQSLKVTRLHHSLGPGNLASLLRDAKFRKALDAAGVNYARFEQLTNS
jgi:ParB/RepB/Spo0J family partition protein